MKISHIIHKIHSLFKKTQEETSKTALINSLIIVVAVIVALGIISKWTFFLSRSLSMEEVKSKTEQFIITNLTNGRSVDIKEISNAGDELYRLIVQPEGGEETIESYVTKDAKLFFPSGMKMNGENDSTSTTTKNSNSQTSVNIPKTSRPAVELFVMSYCPYGTQMEKGIIPALETLGNSIDFKLKFVDYTLHGKKEFDENTRQYCIEKKYPQKLIGYLKCFDGTNGDKCIAQNSMDVSTINDCVGATDKKYNLTDIYNTESKTREGNASYPIYQSENKAYGVAGSPTLVINGIKIDNAKRDSASLLDTICNAFSNKPSSCATKLPSVTPGPGFGDTGAATGSNANCY